MVNEPLFRSIGMLVDRLVKAQEELSTIESSMLVHGVPSSVHQYNSDIVFLTSLIERLEGWISIKKRDYDKTRLSVGVCMKEKKGKNDD